MIEHAYQDKAFPIGEGQTISQPYTVARQSELLGEVKKKRVLEIGTGSGYQACVLMELGAQLVSIECNATLYARARKLLHALGHHPQLFHGDGSLGEARFAPYDAILMTAASPFPPPPLLEQLVVGGCLVFPQGDLRTQQMIRMRKGKNNALHTESFGHFKFVPLRGTYGMPTEQDDSNKASSPKKTYL